MCMIIWIYSHRLKDIDEAHKRSICVRGSKTFIGVSGNFILLSVNSDSDVGYESEENGNGDEETTDILLSQPLYFYD